MMKKIGGEPEKFIHIYAPNLSIEDLQTILSVYTSRGVMCIARSQIEEWIHWKQREKSLTGES